MIKTAAKPFLLGESLVLTFQSAILYIIQTQYMALKKN